MSDDELEALIRAQPDPAPRTGLRAEVLAGVNAALTEADEPKRSSTGVLTRPWPWAIAACVLVGLLVTSFAMESRHARVTADWRGARPARSKQTDRPARGYAEGRALVLALVGEGASDE